MLDPNLHRPYSATLGHSYLDQSMTSSGRGLHPGNVSLSTMLAQYSEQHEYQPLFGEQTLDMVGLSPLPVAVGGTDARHGRSVTSTSRCSGSRR